MSLAACAKRGERESGLTGGHAYFKSPQTMIGHARKALLIVVSVVAAFCTGVPKVAGQTITVTCPSAASVTNPTYFPTWITQVGVSCTIPVDREAGCPSGRNVQTLVIWSCTGGAMCTDGYANCGTGAWQAQLTWQAPAAAGTYTITCSASQPANGTWETSPIASTGGTSEAVQCTITSQPTTQVVQSNTVGMTGTVAPSGRTLWWGISDSTDMWLNPNSGPSTSIGFNSCTDTAPIGFNGVWVVAYDSKLESADHSSAWFWLPTVPFSRAVPQDVTVEPLPYPAPDNDFTEIALDSGANPSNGTCDAENVGVHYAPATTDAGNGRHWLLHNIGTSAFMMVRVVHGPGPGASATAGAALQAAVSSGGPYCSYNIGATTAMAGTISVTFGVTLPPGAPPGFSAGVSVPILSFPSGMRLILRPSAVSVVTNGSPGLTNGTADAPAVAFDATQPVFTAAGYSTAVAGVGNIVWAMVRAKSFHGSDANNCALTEEPAIPTPP